MERLQALGTIIMAGSWGVATVAYGATGSVEFRLFLTVVLACMCAGAVPKLLGSSPHIQIFLGLVTQPLIVVSLKAGSQMNYLVAFCTVPYIFAALDSARHLNSALLSSITFGLERLSLMAATSGVTLICINCDDNETWLADAFALGVDDFIRRGVSGREICARVDAVLRRHYPVQCRQEFQLDYPPYYFDLETRTAWRFDAEIKLTDKAFALAVFLFQNEGRILSRGHLMEAVWRGQASVHTRTIDTHISRIRKHLMIQPEHGYRLVATYGTGTVSIGSAKAGCRRSSPSICRVLANIRGRSAPRSEPGAEGGVGGRHWRQVACEGAGLEAGLPRVRHAYERQWPGCCGSVQMK